MSYQQGMALNFLMRAWALAAGSGLSFQSLHLGLTLALILQALQLLPPLDSSFSSLCMYVYVLLFCFVVIGNFPLFLVRVQCITKHVSSGSNAIAAEYYIRASFCQQHPSFTLKMCCKGFTSAWPTQHFGANLVQAELFWKLG